jgi:hypothetical protein
MKSSFVAVSLLVSTLSFLGCATSHHDPTLWYGLDDARLDAIGEELGFDVEAKGMSSYHFSNAEKTFGITAHNDITRSRHGGPVADEPVVVFYRFKQLAIPVEQGVTKAEITAKIRDFIQKK